MAWQPHMTQKSIYDQEMARKHDKRVKAKRPRPKAKQTFSLIKQLSH